MFSSKIGKTEGKRKFSAESDGFPEETNQNQSLEQQTKENLFLSEGRAFFGKPCFPNTLETKKASLKEDLGHWDPNGGHGFESTQVKDLTGQSVS